MINRTSTPNIYFSQNVNIVLDYDGPTEHFSPSRALAPGLQTRPYRLDIVVGNCRQN
jgi:hypothetical protein